MSWGAVFVYVGGEWNDGMGPSQTVKGAGAGINFTALPRMRAYAAREQLLRKNSTERRYNAAASLESTY